MNNPTDKETMPDVLSSLYDLLDEIKKLQVEANQYNVNITPELPVKPPITILKRDELNKKFEELQNKLEEFSFDEQIKYFAQSSEVITKIEEEINHLNPAYPDPDFKAIYERYQEVQKKIKSENPFFEKSQVKKQNTDELKDVKRELIKFKEVINRREYVVDKLSYARYESENDVGMKADPKKLYLPQIEEALQNIDKLKRKGMDKIPTDKPFVKKAMTMQERAQLLNEQRIQVQSQDISSKKTKKYE